MRSGGLFFMSDNSAVVRLEVSRKLKCFFVDGENVVSVKRFRTV